MENHSDGNHRGRRGWPAASLRGCICPNCRYEQNRSPEVPCYAMKCPRCGAPMTDL